jgi:hypothetical protein
MKQPIHHSHDRIETLAHDVLDEFRAHRLLTRGVARTPLVTVPTTLHALGGDGLYFARAEFPWRQVGYQSHTIYIPRTSLTAVGNRLRGQRLNLRDVLRHELAHALAFRSKNLVRGWDRFAEVFGGHHDSDEPARAPRRAFVTDYARTNPCEDFAECVMVYLRYRGDLDRYARRPELAAKMRLIGVSLPRRIRVLGLGA